MDRNLTQAPLALVMAMALFASPAEAEPARKAPRDRTAVWLSLGVNFGFVEDSDEGCFGGQFGITVAKVLYLRLHKGAVSYEQNDSSNSCDGIVYGDSSIHERGATVGAMLGRGGWFLGVGPSRVELHDRKVLGRPHESAVRFELGWTKRGRAEWILFHVPNEFRDYTGLALNMRFGG